MKISKRWKVLPEISRSRPGPGVEKALSLDYPPTSVKEYLLIIGNLVTNDLGPYPASNEYSPWKRRVFLYFLRRSNQPLNVYLEVFVEINEK
ncbi:hypothetical protein CDL12_00030 [Handroanthus impetiginosus]|uniref:Uncharacterized protein n=1 Tax=Handroanthus impetiginosus TaxID=429701 RepID=A0A2G9IBS4_9LAMI|nr:hypothetical protein CDL12_00030 [Handroanthus impetiginosus]